MITEYSKNLQYKKTCTYIYIGWLAAYLKWKAGVLSQGTKHTKKNKKPQAPDLTK